MQLQEHHVEERVDHGKIDELAFTRSFAMEERHHDGERGTDPTRVVRDRVAGNLRRTFAIARHVGDARETLVVEIVGDHLAVGALLPEARDRNADDVPFDLRKRLVVHLQTLRDAGLETLDDDIDARDELLEDLAARGLLEVDPDAARVAADHSGGNEFLAPLARRFEFDDVRTEITEDLRAVESRPHAGEVEDLYTLEG